MSFLFPNVPKRIKRTTLFLFTLHLINESKKTQDRAKNRVGFGFDPALVMTSVQVNNIVVFSKVLTRVSFVPHSTRAEQGQLNVGVRSEASGGARKCAKILK